MPEAEAAAVYAAHIIIMHRPCKHTLVGNKPIKHCMQFVGYWSIDPSQEWTQVERRKIKKNCTDIYRSKEKNKMIEIFDLF